MSDEARVQDLLAGVLQLQEVMGSVEQELARRGEILSSMGTTLSRHDATLYTSDEGRNGLLTRVALLEAGQERLETAVAEINTAVGRIATSLSRVARAPRGPSKGAEGMDLAHVEAVKGRWRVLRHSAPGIATALATALAAHFAHC